MLKQLIQRLLDSRTTPEQAGHCAMPEQKEPVIINEFTMDKAWHTLVAPFDGYFSIKGISRHMLIENSSDQWSGVSGLTTEGYMGFTLPMVKGHEIRYQLESGTKGCLMIFSRLIGGGYNILSYVGWRGSCLKTSFNFFLKHFLIQRKIGSRNPQRQNSAERLTTQSFQMKDSLLQKTGLLLGKSPIAQEKSIFTLTLLFLKHQLQPTFMFLLPKGRISAFLTSCLTGHILTQPSNSIHGSHLDNVNGGATC